jgi:hypothetical protein
LKAKDFYRILARIREMNWTLVVNPRLSRHEPSVGTFIHGERGSFSYSPLSAVAMCAKRKFFDVSDQRIQRALNLDPRTYLNIRRACYMEWGYSPVVRKKLERACFYAPPPK